MNRATAKGTLPTPPESHSATRKNVITKTASIQPAVQLCPCLAGRVTHHNIKKPTIATHRVFAL